MDINNTLAKQKEIAERINQRAESFSHTPAERKNLSYIQQRIDQLAADWNEFFKNDQVIRESTELDGSNSYFAKNVCKTVEQIYEEYSAELRHTRAVLESYQDQGQKPSIVDDVNDEQQHERVDPAIIFRGSMAALNSSEMGEIPIAMNNLLATVENWKVSFEAYKQQEENWETSAGKTMRTILMQKWKLLSDLHMKLLSSSRYDAKEYYQMENLMEEVMFKHYQDMEEKALVGSSAKLPKLTVPKFSGDYLKWESFKQLFQKMIGSKNYLSGSEKLAYLKGQVEGEPARLISALPVLDSSYATAWDILDERFSDQHMILKKLLDKIFKGDRMNGNSVQNMKETYDAINEARMTIDNMKISNEEMVEYLFYYAVDKRIDHKSLALYENTLTMVGTMRTYDHVMKFLNIRIHHLSNKFENQDTKSKNVSPKSNTEPPNRRQTSIALVASSESSNILCDCKEKHKLFKCPKFLENADNRYKKVRELGRCINCLRSGHMAKDCKARKCATCQKRHNTLLHFEKQKTVLVSKFSMVGNEHVFLATAIVHIMDKYGRLIPARALLDSGAQINLMTERMQKKSGLSYKRTQMEVNGIGSAYMECRKRLNIEIHSRDSNYKETLEVFTLKQVAQLQPNNIIDISNWKIPSKLSLADPEFHIPAKIDLIIGGEIFFNLLKSGKIPLGNGLPVLQDTVFGWIMTGKFLGLQQQQAFVGVVSGPQLDKQLEKFWQIEEKFQEAEKLTPLERGCETFYKNTTKRDAATGKFLVNLQFIKHPSCLGNSEKLAIKRFMNLEKRFKLDSTMKEDYVNFMKEYKELGHMTKVDRKSIDNHNYFIPHHAVRNPGSSTTKFRVVFDASAKTTSNIALNQILANGPKLQDDLFSILARFRTHKYALAADITKMYRQVEVQQEDRKYQMIVWREDESEPLEYYILNTLTYGTTCASYLAIRCLQEIAEQRKDVYPLAAEIAKRDFNVDDMMTGTDDLEEALRLQTEMIEMCKEASFLLHKWSSNEPTLLEAIPKKKREVSLDVCAEKQETKALGLRWIPKEDVFKLSYSSAFNEKVTKRTVLSEAAQLFDPLGIVNPVILKAKIFMQELWSMKLDWDTPLSSSLEQKWMNFRTELDKLNQVEFPRRIVIDNAIDIQLHGFSDASEKAYGTCFYLRSRNAEGKILVVLICSKSRVAPVSKRTLPRLELCGTIIMTELAEKLQDILKIKISSTTYWTDSELVLSWIMNGGSYKTFVANRVAKICRNTDTQQWKYISTKDNPADLISRGVSPETLINSKLWGNGPAFLKEPEENWPHIKPQFIREPAEEKLIKTVLTAQTENLDHFLERINHRNSFAMLKRVVAYVVRVKNWGKCAQPASLQNSEIQESTKVILRYVQQQSYPEELKIISRGQPTKTKFGALSPFIDEKGIMRVGGRIKNASIPFEHKHPAILPKNHTVTRLIFEETHKQFKHPGPQALLSFVRHHYWPEGGKRLAQETVKQCVLCVRSRPLLMQQIMGNLPEERVNIARAFVNISLDFLGPVEVHHKQRGKAATKAYVCIFVCLTTKAVHMEAAADLSIDGFIGCLKRFVARRGVPKKIISDNGTNFRGTHNQLVQLYEMMTAEENQMRITRYCQNQEIDWKFTPARSPHFNGLSEAAVKSAKHHMRRVLRSVQITYDELTTLVAEIEAILNSRPLTPVSNDPNDLQPLTAGHFLVGGPLIAIDDRLLPYDSRTKLWHKIVALRNEFWERWTNEYLSELQGRAKWQKERDNIKVGELLIIKKENTPPLKWRFGRVLKVHKDENGKVRVVDIKVAKAEASKAINRKNKTVDTSKIQTQTKVITRAIHLISPLPVEPKENDKTIRISQVEPSTAPPTHKRKTTVASKNLNPAAKPFEPVANRTRSRGSKGNVLIAILTFLALIFGVNGEECRYKPFQHSPGLYFENYGEMALTTDKWNMIGFVEMTQYWHQEEKIVQMFHKVEDICSGWNNGEVCTPTVNTMAQRIQSLKSADEMFKEYSLKYISRKRRGVHSALGSIAHNTEGSKTGPEKKLYRKRRGWVNFVGSGLKTVTGVMDDDDAQRINADINALKESNNKLLKIIGHQTSIQDLTENIIRQQEGNVHKQIVWLKQQIERMETEKDLDKGGIFATAAVHLSTLIGIQLMNQQALTNLATYVHHGKVSPSIITPSQLKNHLNSIYKNIPNEKMIAGMNDQSNLARIYSILEITVKVTDDRILLKIGIPIMDRDKLKLHRIIPVPFKVGTSERIITTSNQFIALNTRQDRYYLMTEQQYANCKWLDESAVLCDQSHALYNTQGGDLGCEMAILTHSTKGIPPKCPTKDVQATQSWYRLKNPNHVIFAVRNKTVINLICKDAATACSIHDAGMIEIAQQCMIQTNGIEIMAENSYNDEDPIIVAPAINISTLVKVNDNIISINGTEFPLHPLTKELNELHAKIQKQQEVIEAPIKFSSHHVHHYILLYCLLAVTVSFLIISVYCYRKHLGVKKNSKPVKNELSNIKMEEVQF